jgi:hypothetical protein
LGAIIPNSKKVQNKTNFKKGRLTWPANPNPDLREKTGRQGIQSPKILRKNRLRTAKVSITKSLKIYAVFQKPNSSPLNRMPFLHAFDGFVT